MAATLSAWRRDDEQGAPWFSIHSTSFSNLSLPLFLSIAALPSAAASMISTSSRSSSPLHWKQMKGRRIACQIEILAPLGQRLRPLHGRPTTRVSRINLGSNRCTSWAHEEEAQQVEDSKGIMERWTQSIPNRNAASTQPFPPDYVWVWWPRYVLHLTSQSSTGTSVFQGKW